MILLLNSAAVPLESNAWSLREVDSSPAWFSNSTEILTAVTQDSVAVVYTVLSDRGNNWYVRLDGTSEAWFTIENTFVAADQVEQDSPQVTYNTYFGVYQSSPGVVYQLESVGIGNISGNAELPYWYAQLDASDAYQVFNPVESTSVALRYNVRTFAENTTPSIYYRVIQAVESTTVTVTYTIDGTAERSQDVTYVIHGNAEQDSAEVAYDVISGVTQDSAQVVYSITSTPLTASQVVTVTYKVNGTASQLSTVYYDVLTNTEQDRQVTYNVRQGAERDISPVWDLNSVAIQNGTITYQVLGQLTASRDQLAAYTIYSESIKTPNVVGFPYSKAIKKLQQSGLSVGQITYI